MVANDFNSIRWYIMKYTYIPTGIKRELVSHGAILTVCSQTFNVSWLTRISVSAEISQFSMCSFIHIFHLETSSVFGMSYPLLFLFCVFVMRSKISLYFQVLLNLPTMCWKSLHCSMIRAMCFLFHFRDILRIRTVSSKLRYQSSVVCTSYTRYINYKT